MTLRRRTVLQTGLAGTAALGFPAIVRAQADAIRIGHLTPRTGFLGPLGEFAVQAMDLAVDEINAGGGVMGRKLELLKEDSVNPQTASTKAERTKTLFINTGCNSDELRGKGCKKYMFHIESQNSMYVKTCGRSLVAQGLVKGKKWYSLTADYAFGHDLLKVAKRFAAANGGEIANDKLVPTDTTDFSPLLLEIRNAKPDTVISNLAGNQITNFLKQYSEFGLQFPVAGFGFDTALAWGAGKGNFLGTWPVVWHHLLDTPETKKFVAAFLAKYGRPPENQAWGEYNAMKLVAQAIAEIKSVDSTKLVEHFEKGAKFPLMKTREGYFRKSDHQMMHEMYTVQALPAAQIKNNYDIFSSSAAVPAPNESLEVIASTAEENECRMA